MRQHDSHKKFLTIGFYVDLEDRTVSCQKLTSKTLRRFNLTKTE